MPSYSMTSVSLNHSYCLYFSRVILHHSSSFCINLIGCFRHGPRSRSFGKGPSWLFQRGQFLPLRPSVRCVFRKYDTEAPWFKEHLWGCGCDFANPSALVYLLKNTKAPYLRYRIVCLCLLPLIMLQMTGFQCQVTCIGEHGHCQMLLNHKKGTNEDEASATTTYISILQYQTCQSSA